MWKAEPSTESIGTIGREEYTAPPPAPSTRPADPVRKQRAQPLGIQPSFQGRGEFLDGKQRDAVFAHQPDHLRGIRLALPGVEAS